MTGIAAAAVGGGLATGGALFGAKKLKKALTPKDLGDIPEQKPIEPEQELKAPTLDDAAPAAQKERKRNLRQRGRASTILNKTEEPTGTTAKATLGI